MVTKQNGNGLRFIAAAIAFGALSSCATHRASAQSPSTLQATSLIVDGSVQRVYQSGSDFLVQILVQRAEAPRLDAAAGLDYPAPGQNVYVHVNGDRSIAGRLSRAAGGASVPDARSVVRAFLTAGRDGTWNGAGNDWYTDDLSPTNGTGGLGSGSDFGITSQRVSVGGEIGLKVLTVSPNSPAGKAGIEPGDILMQANRVALQSEAQLSEAYRASRGEFSLTVRDVKSGRDVLVKIPAASSSSSGAATARPLGVKSELAFYEGNPAVKLTEVDPRSPAGQAGLAAGLLILKANGKTIESPDDLEKAVQQSRGVLDLQVFDPTNRREQTIRVGL